eukprot:CAMPEP_0201494258 /NCGR_PEP_ID=MMETSP0151_2-20130828/46307_1 /ASSEMBLY_ACC=CAM_ASM_000257 /TAXON_ID=200890 /ORGANISM="Paramoeba atlantica, Strain 621/1 / CCAP 1560/9" /LENGTH=144 /DNA_ID=CAMNT_0047882387 /DNA_START=38 /DNA_END=469 /DNA_ORIENTATION=+
MNISESSSSQSPVPPEILVPFPSSSTTPYPSPLPPPSIAPSIISSSSDTASSLSVETIQSPPKIQPGPPEETKEKDTESKRKYVQVCQVEEDQSRIGSPPRRRKKMRPRKKSDEFEFDLSKERKSLSEQVMIDSLVSNADQVAE